MVKARKSSQKPKYEYQILMNKKVVWHGINAKDKLAEFAKKYPKMQLGIRWIPKEGVLIAKASISI